MQRANKGHIVTVGSVMGLMGARKLTDYCASKFALHGFHEALVMELDSYSGALFLSVLPRVVFEWPWLEELIGVFHKFSTFP